MLTHVSPASLWLGLPRPGHAGHVAEADHALHVPLLSAGSRELPQNGSSSCEDDHSVTGLDRVNVFRELLGS